MRLALVYLWKEWRAQRGILLAYTGLIFACLCLGLSLAPRHVWFEESFGVHALTWFVAAGVIGVVAFVAPGLVRCEFTTKSDQFVRRLPGALAPAFGGKLLFLVLATLLMPLLGLLVGEWFVQWRGADWSGLFRWDWTGLVRLMLPWVVYVTGGGLVLVTWVWAVAMWMPGGRMALGGTALLVLLLGVMVFAVMRQCPGIEKTISWQPWLWAVLPTGLAVAALSWIRGRRGGGVLRSARVGLLAAGIAFVPSAAWLGERAWDYHHPDLDQLGTVYVRGLSPDARFALLRVAESQHHQSVTLRVDLATGEAEQIGGVHTYLQAEVVGSFPRSVGKQRLWLWQDHDAERSRLLDLVMGEWTDLAYESGVGRAALPEAMEELANSEASAALDLQAPGGARVWYEARELRRQGLDGCIKRTPWPYDRGPFRAAGHGFWQFEPGRQGSRARLFTADGRDTGIPEKTGMGNALVVRDQVVFGSPNGRFQQGIGGEAWRCEALEGKRILGLLDDDHLLCVSSSSLPDSRRRLWLYQPAARRLTEIGLPPGLPGWLGVNDRGAFGGSLLPRDPLGRIWLRDSPKEGRGRFLLLDPQAQSFVKTVPIPKVRSGPFRLIAFLDGDHALASDGERVLRFDASTGATETLFPREASR